MHLNKTAAGQRAALPRRFDCTKGFANDWQRLTRSGRYDMRQLKQAMLLLAPSGAPLGAEWLDHPLKGDWADHGECHIGGDFLLIYRSDDIGLVFVSAGTHADLFGA